MRLFFIFAIMLGFLACTNESSKKDDIPDKPNEIRPLKIGDKIPDFKLIDIEGKEFNIHDYLKRKPTIILYYRGGWCLYCNLHLGQIQEIEQQLFDLGFQILGISADLKEKNLEMLKKHNIHYDLASDIDLNGAKTLGLVYNAEKLYGDMLDVLEEYSGSKKHLLPVPAAFIVDQNAIIHFEYINPNFKIRIDPELLLTAAKVFLKIQKKSEEKKNE